MKDGGHEDQNRVIVYQKLARLRGGVNGKIRADVSQENIPPELREVEWHPQKLPGGTWSTGCWQELRRRLR